MQEVKLKWTRTPRPIDEVTHYTYHIQASLRVNEIVVEKHRNQAGRFILATNLLDEEGVVA